MVAVFSIFATMSFLDLKILGIGMASAVLIDATVVRGILLPAALALLGDRTWSAPRWLRRLASAGSPEQRGSAAPRELSPSGSTATPTGPPARQTPIRGNAS